MRRITVVALIVVAVLVGILFTVVATMNVDRFRPQIQSQLQAKLNRPVQIGHIGLRLLPFAVRLNDVTIGEPPSFPSQQPFVTAKEVDASVGLFSLISGQPNVKSVRLVQPHIEVIRNTKGVWNISTPGGAGSVGGSQT